MKTLLLILSICSLSIYAQSSVKKASANNQKDSIKVEIKNLGSVINSPFSDYAPLISSDGTSLVFTSQRPLNNKDYLKGRGGLENVYISYYDDKNSRWLVTFMFESVINSLDIDNSAIALSNDGQKMLLYRGGNIQNANGDILESLLSGNEWSDPTRLSPQINSDENETSASISPDGKTIYFISDRAHGIGGKDIWYCTQNESGDWNEAVNMGNLLNSSEAEESVFIHPNGKVLFFSSKGHNAIGGFDIYMSVFDETTQTWAKPENLGYPINSVGDEIYFVMQANGKTGYYASSMAGGNGDLDIYSISFLEDIMKKNMTQIMGRVINKSDNPVGSTIVIKNKSTDKLIGSFKSNNASGKYIVSVPPGKKYELEITSDGYKTDTISLDIPFKAGYQEYIKDIVLDPK